MADKNRENYVDETPRPETSSGVFHGLFNDDKESNPTAAPCPVKVANAAKEAKFNDTTEAPCFDEPSKMDADVVRSRHAR